jgi:hypothetical protein
VKRFLLDNPPSCDTGPFVTNPISKEPPPALPRHLE